MDALHWIAEQLIEEAIKRGEFDNLPGKGRPLKLKDDSHIPPELRMAYKILKNSGHAPPELEEQKEISRIEDLLENCKDEQERLRQIKKLNYLVMKLNARRRKHVDLERKQRYYGKIVQRVDVPDKG
ncbi:MAG: DnaJ family domain-containing protein [Desulfovibrionales bacterium]